MTEFLDFFKNQHLNTPILIFIGVFSLAIAIFQTLLFNRLFTPVRPKWLFYVFNPLIIGLASLAGTGFSLLAFIILFMSVFLLAIALAIKSFFTDSNHDKNTVKKTLSKKVMGVIAFIIFIPIFFALGPYAVLLIIALGFLSGMLPNSKNRFKRYQSILPTSKIRSLAMGLAEVKGRLVAGNMLAAPIDNVPCIGYKYVIENITRDKDGHESYSEISSETICNEFSIQDDTGSIPVNPEKLEFVWVSSDGSYKSGSTRYTQYLIKDNNSMLIIGKASVRENNEPVLEYENNKKVFGIAPDDKVNNYNKFKPLLNSFMFFSCILAFMLAVILVSPVSIYNGRVVVHLNLAIFSWDNFLNF